MKIENQTIDGKKATEEERNEGLDLADYLTRFDYKEFIV